MARWRLGSDVDQLRSIRSNCIVGFHMNPAASSKGHESTEDLRPRRERLPTHFPFLYGLHHFGACRSALESFLQGASSKVNRGSNLSPLRVHARHEVIGCLLYTSDA